MGEREKTGKVLVGYAAEKVKMGFDSNLLSNGFPSDFPQDFTLNTLVDFPHPYKVPPPLPTLQ